jgi:hypothetical protein
MSPSCFTIQSITPCCVWLLLLLLCAVNTPLNLTKTKVRQMRKLELQDLCADLGLDVADCRVKLDYVNKVLAAMQQRLGTRATQQANTDAEPTQPKVHIAQPPVPSAICAHTHHSS